MNVNDVSDSPASAIDSEPNQRPSLIELADFGLLGIEGPDAAKFLQGQVTCDIRELAAPVSTAGAQCNPKGRMLSSFRLIQTGPEKLLLRTLAVQLDNVSKDLRKYIVFSKAGIVDYRSRYRLFGLLGPNATALVEKFTGLSLAQDQHWIQYQQIFFIRLDHQRIECWVENNQLDTFLKAFSSLTVPAPANAWTLATIRAGFGEVHPETRELFTPQSLNYQLVNAISFRKGCYTGQEIVARLHYKATLKRHMYRVAFTLANTADLPAPGSGVVNENGKSVGEVVMSAFVADHQAEALVVAPDNQLDNLYPESCPDVKLMPLDLPYVIPREDNQ